MKLFYSATSPYVRKVTMCAAERGIGGQIERVPCNPHASPPDLLAANPLSKVPTLLTADGVALFDSRLICEFLDGVGDTAPMVPAAGPQRLRALRAQAIGDGVLDAAVLRRMEMGRADDDHREAVKHRQRDAVLRALDVLEREPPGTAPDIGGVTVACALGYLDFRFPHEPWRERCPALAAWFAAFSARDSFLATMPQDPV